jgi:2,3-dihydroxyphenylpropionate 1,2-dioxygenase
MNHTSVSPFLVCSSHPPLLLIRPREPVEEAAFVARREALRAAIESFDPEQIVFFGNDHFAGFHYAVMPPFCVGFAAEAVNDLGGFPGKLDVPKAEAERLVVGLREEGFDPAVSYRMRVDHAFSQPLTLLTGGLDRYPVIPVFISVFTPPFMPFSRSRRFGEAVGRQVARSGKRTLFMGTGGLSHHPVRYFPLMDDAPPDVLSYQMEGARGGLMDDAAWFERFDRMHREGAELAASGQRTARDMRLNPEIDRHLIGVMQSGRLDELDGWAAEDLVRDAGVGCLEVHNWIAATAAWRAAGGSGNVEALYAPVVEYGTAFGMIWSAQPAGSAAA